MQSRPLPAASRRRAFWIVLWLGLALVAVSVSACRREVGSLGRPEVALSAVTPRPFLTVEVGAQVAATAAAAPTLPLGQATPMTQLIPTVVAATVAPIPTLGAMPVAAAQTHTVQAGENLISIAARFNTTVEQLMAVNGMSDPNTIFVGQILQMPGPIVAPELPPVRLLPDSEVVYGPGYRDWQSAEVIGRFGGYLATHTENVEGEMLSGPAIIDRVAARYSVGPRVLLALLEYQSGWVTQTAPAESSYPAGMRDPGRAGLFRQLSWAANTLNAGYYGALLQRETVAVRFPDGARYRLHADTNPGSAALQYLFAQTGDQGAWERSMNPDGFRTTYNRLFGSAEQYAVEPLMRPDMVQPTLVLPWKQGETWYFTGGPHGGWNEGSSRAALDFAPPTNTLCQPAPEMVTASADGIVTRSEGGEVVVDLDGDGFAGTGWVILYMHIGTEGRVPVGTRVRTGDPIGYPSCEGGASDAAHLHMARRYNGQWIPADGPIPFVIGGWRAANLPRSYDGTLTRDGRTMEACACRGEYNQLVSGR